MTLKEALESGRRYRRKGHDFWYQIPEKDRCYFDVDEICATDWEVQEETVTITRGQYFDALRDYICAASRDLFKSNPTIDDEIYINSRIVEFWDILIKKVQQ